jgi:hypothetical protein
MRRRFLDGINKINRMDLRRKKDLGISRRDAGAQRKSKAAKEKGIKSAPLVASNLCLDLWSL